MAQITENFARRILNDAANKQASPLTINEMCQLACAFLDRERLRKWIREQGSQNNTCTFNVLGKICEGCGCGKITPPVSQDRKSLFPGG